METAKRALRGTQETWQEIELKIPVGTVVWKELEDKSKNPNADVGWGDDNDFSRWGTSVPVSQTTKMMMATRGGARASPKLW